MTSVSVSPLQAAGRLACGTERNTAFYGAVWRQGVKGGQGADAHPCMLVERETQIMNFRKNRYFMAHILAAVLTQPRKD